MTRLLANTPSAGVNEVLRALYLARGHDGNKVLPVRVLRELPAHTSLTDVTTILDAQVIASHVATAGGKYALTTAGVAFSRAHKPRHSKVVVGW